MATLGDVDTSKVDFYEFLGLTQGSAASVKEINRAGRQTSFRYHPDKVAATPENLENFHIAQIAIGILTDPEQKAKYDQQRDAKLRRKAEVEALDERRRAMAEDLERREKNGMNGTNVVAGQKRTFSERDMKIRAAQEANRKKLEQRNAAVRFEAEKKAAEERAQTAKADGAHSSTNDHQARQTSQEKDDSESNYTSIRLKWIREGEGQGYDELFISSLYPADDVDNIILLKDKKRKIEGHGKVMVGTAVVIFKSTVKAKQAMSQKAALLDRFDTVEWLDTGSKGD